MARTLLENANYINSTIKPAIKNAIIAQGVSVSDSDSFLDYATKIGQIGGGGFSMGISTIVSNVVSNLDATQTLTDAGLYVVLFSCGSNNGGDQGYITYSGTDGSNYNLIHSYRASNASPAATYPTIAIDLVEIVSSTTVTMFSYGQGRGGVSYAILKLNGVTDFGNVVNETHYRGYNQVDTVSISSLTITTDNILVLAFGTAKYDDRNRSYASLVSGAQSFAFNPFRAQMGEAGYSDGFAMIIPKTDLTSVSTYSSDDTSKCIFIAEVS